MNMTAQPQATLLEMTSITKSFLGAKALIGATLKVNSSEVHALVGQNGAGKSTLIKILTGAYRRDEGSVKFNGQEIDFTSPQTAQNAGISTIYQEVNLVPLRTVTENIFLGREKKRFGLLEWRKMNQEATELLKRFDVQIDVTQPLGSFNIAVQQMVAIARAVSVNAKLVVMDEPTSSLDEREVEVLFNVIRQLKRDGVSVIFITHRLDELYAVCDRITILRDGRTVYESDMQSIGKLELVSRMIGKKLDEVVAAGQTAFEKRDVVNSKPLLEATGLSRKPRIRDVSVSVKSGEIVGIAGLLGAGRTETARLIFGADSLEKGTVRFEGRNVNFRSPADAIKAGLGFCSEDRKVEGIIPQMSVQENLTLALLPMLAKAGIVDTTRQEELVKTFIQKLGIKTAGPHQPIRELSGGNQQKVLLARWLCMTPKLLILDEPTRGIDVGAKAEIQKLINELAEQGLGVLMISSELEELSEGCDQVVVLRDGKSVTALAGDEVTEEAIMQVMATGSASSIEVSSTGVHHAP
jgi:galactofuranose transport system ATP-binding protein